MGGGRPLLRAQRVLGFRSSISFLQGTRRTIYSQVHSAARTKDLAGLLCTAFVRVAVVPDQFYSGPLATNGIVRDIPAELFWSIFLALGTYLVAGCRGALLSLPTFVAACTRQVASNQSVFSASTNFRVPYTGVLGFAVFHYISGAICDH